MMRFLLALMLLASTFPSVARQKPLSPPLLGQLTQGVEKEPMVQAAAEQLNWFESNRYGVAYGDELDFRLGQTTNDRKEYGFRFRPTNPFYFAAGRQMGQVLEQKAQLMYREAVEQAIYERALELFEIWESSATLQHIREATAWRAQWIASMSALVATGDFDPEQLLDLEIEKIDLSVDAAEAEDNLEIDLLQLEAQTGTPLSEKTPEITSLLLSFRFDSLLVENLIKVVGNADSVGAPMSLEIEKGQLAVDESRARVLLEKTDWDVGFVQPEWDDQGGDNFGIRIGLGIPIFRGNRLQRQNRQLELIGDKWEQVKALSEWEQEITKANSQVLQWANRLLSLNELSLQLSQRRQGMASLEGDKARETLLKWTKANEKLSKRKIEVQFLLLYSYLDYLKLTGQLNLTTASTHFEIIW